jgi:hypothetical protein
VGIETTFCADTPISLQVSEKSSASEVPPNGGLDRPRVQSIDPVEAALAGALEAASRAGEWSVVAKLAAELEARRLARANVVDLASARRERGLR